jgi:acetoin utilization deacetylase AcuC-like enzyme
MMTESYNKIMNSSDSHDVVFYYPEGHAAHAEFNHPERPERVETMVMALKEKGWWQQYPHIPPANLPRVVIESVHSPAYLNLLEMACRRGGWIDVNTYVKPASWKIALETAGGALAVAEAVWKREARRGFALTRPPGHHASHGQGDGFCLINNIAVAAEGLVQLYGAERLAIVDLDLHHGNGTQDIFWKRRDVFYISTHQVPLYPGSGYVDERGEGDGEGFTANFPMPPGAGDQAFKVVMDELILPLLANYRPQMILVSFGFDPLWLDPLGQLLLSVNGYATLIHKLVEYADANCQGRLALFLEGGYDLKAAAASAKAVTAALLRQVWDDPLGPSPYPERENWKHMVDRAKTLWQLG